MKEFSEKVKNKTIDKPVKFYQLAYSSTILTNNNNEDTLERVFGPSCTVVLFVRVILCKLLEGNVTNKNTHTHTHTRKHTQAL